MQAEPNDIAETSDGHNDDNFGFDWWIWTRSQVFKWLYYYYCFLLAYCWALYFYDS
jgi:hypothetical protein